MALVSQLQTLQHQCDAASQKCAQTQERLDFLESGIRKIDPLKLGEKRVYSSWLPNFLIDLGYKIRSLMKRHTLSTYLEQRKDLSKDFALLSENLAALTQKVKDVSALLQREQQRLSPAQETAAHGLAAGTLAGVIGLSTPVVAAIGVSAAAATFVYRRWWTCPARIQIQKQPQQQVPQPIERQEALVAQQTTLAEFLQKIPALQRLPKELIDLPADAHVMQEGDKLTIILPHKVDLSIDFDHSLSEEEIKILLSANKGQLIAADTRVEDLQRFGSIGPRTWANLKKGFSLSSKIVLLRKGNSLEVEQGLPNGIKRLSFDEEGKVTASIQVGIGMLSKTLVGTYNLRDLALLFSLLHA